MNVTPAGRLNITSAAIAACLGLAASTPALAQQAVQWRVEDGGNGHWYRVVAVMPFVTWSAADSAARSTGGHLASIGSAAENSFVRNLAVATPNAVRSTSGIAVGPWIGASRDPQSGQFRWSSGEPWAFSAWCGGEPTGPLWEDCVCFYTANLCWNDRPGEFAGTTATPSYAVEWFADCDQNGIVDYGEILDGTLADTNANGVPDCCDQGVPCVPCVPGSCPCPTAAVRQVPSTYPSIQAAIAAAAPGDCVLVAPGTYVESLNFLGKPISLRPEGDPLSVTLMAPPGMRAIRFVTGEGSHSIVRDLRIAGDGPIGPIGGGIVVQGSSPTIESCEIVDIHAPVSEGSWGGAVDVVSGSPMIRDCLLRGNRVSDGSIGRDGGALLVRGGSPTVEDCVFRDNPSGQGADVFLVSSLPVTATLSGCTFSGTSGGGFGARIYNYGQGGGAATVMLVNCVFDRIEQNAISLVHGWDTVSTDGTAYLDCRGLDPNGLVTLHTQGRSVLTVTNCSLIGNVVETQFGIDGTQGGLGSVSSSEFCRNEPPEPDYGPRLTDAGGNATCCPADIHQSGTIDAEDLAYVLLTWGTDGGKTPEADINRDGTVNANDLSVVLGSWGPCP